MTHKHYIAFFLLLPFLFSCQEDENPNAELDERLNEQIAEIETYLSDNNISTAVENGYYLEQITENPDGKVPQQEDVVLAYYNLQTLDGSPIDQLSQADGDEPAAIPYIQGRVILPIALYDLIGDMRAGEEVRAYVPFNRAYFDYELADVIPALTAIILQLEVVDVLSPEEFALRQNTQIKAYLQESKLQPADSLEGGVYYHRVQSGESPEVDDQSTVRVRYTGSLLDGTQFDSNVDAPTPFRVVMSEDGVISGFKTGLSVMSQLEEGVAVMPAAEAYGPNYFFIPFAAMSDFIAVGAVPGSARLGTYAILRFDLEVESVN